MNNREEFRRGRSQIMQTLDNIERTKGAAEAKSAARARASRNMSAQLKDPTMIMAPSAAQSIGWPRLKA